MDDRRVTALRVLAGALVFATATFHLLSGFPRALIYLQATGMYVETGQLPDPRPFFFVVYGVVLLAGPYLVTRDLISLRRAYRLGAVVMVLGIAAWMGWHLTDHLAFLFPANTVENAQAGHTGIVTTLVEHYTGQPIEGAIKTIEFGAALTFGGLLRWDPAVRGGE